MSTSIKWLGTAGLELQYNEQIVLLDPYLSRLNKWKVAFCKLHPDTNKITRYLGQLPSSPSALIVTHTHFDHVLDIPSLLPHIQGPVVGSDSLATILEMVEAYDRVTICHGNETLALTNDITVTMIRSRHGLVILGRVPYPGENIPASLPWRTRDYRHGLVFIPKIVMPELTLMAVSSAHFIPETLEGHRCDVLFLCVPGWKRVAEYPEKLIEIVQPQVVIPIHFDDFTKPVQGKTPLLPKQDLEGFSAKIRKSFPKIDLKIPEIGIPLKF
ncbi:MAG: MBL fold metallo-hydrolase [SAR324 cluster bacterium]|nr:MBL fold metallo-hydrolase [SAR324 cluster bacterium]